MKARKSAAGTSFVIIAVLTAAAAVSLVSCARKSVVPGIFIAKNASWQERAAAKELRRYFYLRTGELVRIRERERWADVRGDAVVVLLKGGTFASGLAALSGSASNPSPSVPLPASVPAANSASSTALSSGQDGSTSNRAGSASAAPAAPSVAERIAALGDQDYLLKTIPAASGKILVVAGGAGPSVLYAAYQVAEKLGVRFYLDGDVVPDARAASISLDLDETGHPLFAIRGIQPFHDFPEGPDWWDRANYKAILGQLPKLRMNFLGFHTYPENPSKERGATPNAEPTVWIGSEGDYGADGKVTASYPSSYQNTARGNWGYEAKKTSDFHFGASLLFESDDFGNDVMAGYCPGPSTPADENAVFDRAADVFKDSFTLARKLGVKTCAGTETALTIPELVRDRLKAQGRDPKDPAVVKDVYKGLFGRIAAAYPIDYYWFWTNENWTWSDASPDEIKSVATDLGAALEAWRETKPPFRLATCGWVLGPPSNRTLFDQVMPKDVAMSCINREVGKTPVDPGFSRISGRPLWAIPWLEDDPSLTSPQLWVGRMRRDAADARRYGCDGLLGIHWRTRILSANVLALARAAWDQPWNMLPANIADEVGPITGQYVAFKEPIAGFAGLAASPVYRDVRDRVFAYHIPLPNGRYTVTLKFVEGQVENKRGRVFDVSLQGKKVIDSLDIFARVGKFRALDFSFGGIDVKDGRLAIDFADRINYPAIAAIEIEGRGFSKKINCGGPAVDGYEADGPETPRFMPSLDFYRDWAANQFGPAVADEAAAILARIDGVHPVPVTWIGGPGNIQPDPRPWDEVKKGYAFIDDFAALAAKVSGAGCRERFDYWLKSFEYMREIARFNGLWAQFNAAMDKAKAEKNDAARLGVVKDAALPIRVEMAACLRRIFDALLATVSTTGELGTIANWEQHLLPGAWERPEAELEKMLGAPPPADARLGTDYAGETRIVVPALRTGLETGEALDLKVIILGKNPPEAAEIRWRELGKGSFRSTPLSRVGRGVYRVTIPAPSADFEYYIRILAGGKETFFPATAPGLNQTVVLF